jgi:1,4-dihydroxy-2-naphthoyl-CoA hydrolase
MTMIESKTNFIRPVDRGRRTQVWQTRITTREGKLAALVTQTQLVL